MNTDAPWPNVEDAGARVLEIQTKLHRWAGARTALRFDDLYNLVCDPAFLLTAWHRVRGNRGARSTGVDRQSAYSIETRRGAEAFLRDLREQLKQRRYRPLPVRERLIPKADGRMRRLGIPTVTDRVVQAAVKLVLEPIFEADFQPCSYGFRPKRRAQDAIAEIHFLTSRRYEWIVEADIEACFDRIGHAALLGRVAQRIGDRRILALVKAFLKAGILTELGDREATLTGTPQGGILSPLLANIALSALDEYFAQGWQSTMSTAMRRRTRRRKGLGCWRLVRYADDFVIMVAGTRDNAQALLPEVAAVLAPLGLNLSAQKTKVLHVDEGFDFLGFHIRRRTKRGTRNRHTYTYPSRKALRSVRSKVRGLTCRSTAPTPPWLMLHRVSAVVRGWAHYFRHGVSKACFSKLDSLVWRRFTRWLRKRHPHVPWRVLQRMYMQRWRIVIHARELFRAASIPVTRYRYRGAMIPTPWTSTSSVSGASA